MTVTWVILAGLPGTGKSTLARALAPRLDGVVLDKDRVREALFPDAMTDYSREQDDLCMRAMLEAAAYLTERHRVGFIFLDGRTFSRHQQINEVVQAAEQAGARWRILHVMCSDGVAEARLSRPTPRIRRRIAMWRFIGILRIVSRRLRIRTWRRTLRTVWIPWSRMSATI
jgi:predicted kinase